MFKKILAGVSLMAFLIMTPNLMQAKTIVNYRGEPAAAKEVIIKFKDDYQPKENILRQYKLKDAKSIIPREDSFYLSDLEPSIRLKKVLKKLNNDYRIEYAEPNYIVEIEEVPNDTMFDSLWSLHNIGQSSGVEDADIDAVEAWDLATDSMAVPVGVIDSGINYNHEDLAENIWRNPGEIADNGIDDDDNGYVDDVYGWDFKNNDNDPMDDNGHGTHVAGIIGAVGNNNKGVAGVSWKAQLVALKFLGTSGSGYYSDALEAIAYADKMDIPITNNSWSGGSFSVIFYQALSELIDKQLFIAAAGNNSQDADIYSRYPSAYDLDNIISVASTDRLDGLSGFSNYGAISVDLGAPGSSIYSTTKNGNYGRKSGTSMASPHVAGVAALLWAYQPELTLADVKQILLDSGDVLPALEGKTVSGKRLNLYQALESATEEPEPDPEVDVITSSTAEFYYYATNTSIYPECPQGYGRLYVVAASSGSPEAELSIDSYGKMSYLSKSGVYRYSKYFLDDRTRVCRPENNLVTIKSTLGGSLTTTVECKQCPQ